VTRRGFTLLETMVALVILGVAVAGYLELFGGSTRLAATSHTWSQALGYAEEALEEIKLDPRRMVATIAEPLPGGFTRTIRAEHWSSRLELVTVVVGLPTAGELRVARLVEIP
jgi:prepilin-type N-terminal cleavage/methylation domain-containing protein